MLNEISYLLVQGEILEVLMTTEERAIQEIISKVGTRVLRLRSCFLENFTKVVLGPIYTVRLCRMRQAYDRLTTRIVSCKSNLQLAYDS